MTNATLRRRPGAGNPRVWLVAVSMLVAALSGAVAGDTFKWTGSKTGVAYWSDPANWDQKRLPAAGDTALFQGQSYDLLIKDAHADGLALVAMSYGRIAFADGTFANLKLAAYDDGTFVVTNGMRLAGCTLATATGSAIELAGGFSTNTVLSLTSATTAREFKIGGGFHHFASDFTGAGGCVYRQTGGHVSGQKLNHANGGKPKDVFYYLDGGRLDLYNSGWTLGFGLQVSNDAQVFYDSAMDRLWFSTFGYDHTLTVKDSADVYVKGLNMLQGPSMRATVDLQGGTFRVGSGGVNRGDNIPADCCTEFLLDGGTWLVDTSLPGGSNGTLPAGLDLRVKEGGAKFDLRAGGLTVNSAFVSGVTEGRDGGLVKTGAATFELRQPCTFSGDLVHKEGWIYLNGDTAVPAFGTGDFVLDGGQLLFLRTTPTPVATAAGRKFVFGRGSVVHSWGAQKAGVIGPADAANGDASFVARDGGGVLFLKASDGAQAFGSDAFLRVNGGLSTQANGRVRKPVATVNSDALVRLAAYDATVGFTSATCGATWGAANLVEVPADGMTVTEDVAADSLQFAQGATLTLGSSTLSVPGDGAVAMVALNAGTIDGGAVDFGTARGVFALRGSGAVKAELKGTGGVTYAAPVVTSATMGLWATSDYSGDTWLDNVSLTPYRNHAFGRGTIHVQGNARTGGQLKVTNVDGSTCNQVTNDLVVAGTGPNGNGSIWFHLGSGARHTISGAVELADDTTFSIGFPSTYADFTGPISGAGKLTLRRQYSAGGEFSFMGLSTATGGLSFTDVIVKTDDPAKLGTGAIMVGAGATLRINQTGAVVFTQKITGTGTIELTGATSVAFADATGFTGRVVTTAPVQVTGRGLTVDADAWTSDVVGGVDARMLELRSETGDANSFFGAVSGAGLSLVKTGAGVQTIASACSNGGTTYVFDGTLSVNPDVVGGALDAATTLRLDATAEGTLTTEEDGGVTRVVAWRDADGRAIAVTNSAANAPSLTASQINGHPALYLTGAYAHNEWLAANVESLKVRTVALVYAAKGSGGDHPNGSGNGWVKGTHVLGFDATAGLDTSSGRWDTSNWGSQAKKWISDATGDAAVTTGTADWKLGSEPQLLILELKADGAGRIDIGEYLHDPANARPYYGHLGEIRFFNRVLTDGEREELKIDMLDRWGIRARAPKATSNLLNTATKVVVAAGATLTLACDQTVAGLAGTGVVTGTTGATLTVAGTEDYASVDAAINGALAFAKTGAGVLTLRGALAYTGATRVEDGTLALAGVTLPAGTDLFVAAGATLDLGGQTVTVASVAGAGRIENGALAVTGNILPGGAGTVGSLTLDAALASGTLVLDGDRATGASDELLFPSGSVADGVVVTRAAGLSAAFWRIERKAGLIHLKRNLGTTLILR